MIEALLSGLLTVDPYSGADAADAAEVERVLYEDHGISLIERDMLARYETVVEAAQLHAELPAHRPVTLKLMRLAMEDLERGRRESAQARSEALEAAVRHAGVGPLHEDDARPGGNREGAQGAEGVA